MAREGNRLITWWERAWFTIAALLLTAALGLPAVVRAVDPTLAVLLAEPAFHEFVEGARQAEWDVIRLNGLGATEPELLGRPDRDPPPVEFPPELVDPWGRPWRWAAARPRDRAPRWMLEVRELDVGAWVRGDAYSVGPDGVDEGGAGDDIAAWSASGHPARRLVPAPVRRAPRLALVLAAVCIVLWTVVTRGAARAPRGGAPREALRVVGLAALPATAAALWLWPWDDWTVKLELQERLAESDMADRVLVAADTLFAGTWATLVFTAALAWRLSRPRADTQPDPAQPDPGSIAGAD